jgi:hypothetical protein
MNKAELLKEFKIWWVSQDNKEKAYKDEIRNGKVFLGEYKVAEISQGARVQIKAIDPTNAENKVELFDLGQPDDVKEAVNMINKFLVPIQLGGRRRKRTRRSVFKVKSHRNRKSYKSRKSNRRRR